MTVLEQIRTLWRQFPRSPELAVTRDMLESYVLGHVFSQRFDSAVQPVYEFGPIERFGKIAVQRTPICFRNARLVIVEVAA